MELSSLIYQVARYTSHLSTTSRASLPLLSYMQLLQMADAWVSECCETRQPQDIEWRLLISRVGATSPALGQRT